MIPYELQHVSLGQIEIFFRCTETKNFTKAAESLHITPGMVSKKIAALEDALGVALFAREKNRVALTSEGEALYTAWRPSVETMIRSAADIRGRASRSGTVSMVIWGGTNLERFLVPLLSACSADTDMSFRITMSDMLDYPAELSSGNYDVAIVPKFAELGFRQREELEFFLVLPSPLYAVLSPDNPLSRKPSLKVEDLRDLNLLTPEGALPLNNYKDMLRDVCLSHGITPRFRVLDAEEFRTIYLFLDEESVFVTDKYFHAFFSNAAEYRELEDTESGLLLAYRKDSPPHVRSFVDYTRGFYMELR